MTQPLSPLLQVPLEARHLLERETVLNHYCKTALNNFESFFRVPMRCSATTNQKQISVH
jgi:hypothetical protein